MKLDSLADAVSEFVTQKKIYRHEGMQGVKNLCQLVAGLGYKDSTYFGQLDRNAVIGDLIEFLSDNPGAIEALTDWISNQHSEEWQKSLESQLELDDESEEDDTDEA